MATSAKMRDSAHKENVRLTEKEKFQLAIWLGVIACGIILTFGLAMYFFGAEATINATIGTLALGAIVSLGAVVCLKNFWAPR